MVDTVKLRIKGSTFLSQSPEGWTETTRVNYGNIISTSGMRYGGGGGTKNLTHRRTGLSIFQNSNGVMFLQVSLPRLLFGHNGHLLASQAQLDMAVERVFTLFKDVATTPMEYEFTRVDLCWQFRANMADWLLAHRYATHPSTHKEVSPYKSGLGWYGAQFQARLYDKDCEMNGVNGDVARLEFTLSSKKLSRTFNRSFRPVTKLNFQQCYQMFRRLALGLQPRALPRLGSVQALMAVAAREKLKATGVPLVELHLHGKSKKYARRLRRQITAFQLQHFSLDWNKLLPVDTLPPVVEVTPRKVRNLKSNSLDESIEELMPILDGEEVAFGAADE